MATIIISAVLAVILIAIVNKLIKDKKAGKGCCADCSACGGGCGK